MLKILHMTAHLLSRAKKQGCYPEKAMEKLDKNNISPIYLKAFNTAVSSGFIAKVNI